MDEVKEFSELIGKTIINITKLFDDSLLIIICSDGEVFELQHFPTCCEGSYLQDICGDLEDILVSPIVLAEESTKEVTEEEISTQVDTERSIGPCYNWTFYKLATIKGSVTLRFLGDNNGCYSTKVELKRIR